MKIEVSEWETDPKTGQRFRRVGNSIEYEMMVCVDGIEIPESELAAYHERKKAVETAQHEAEKNRPTPPPQRNCPFKDGLQTHCDGEKCALFVEGCILARISDSPPLKDTTGHICPFNRCRSRCRADCALYENGCKITSITKGESEETDNEQV